MWQDNILEYLPVQKYCRSLNLIFCRIQHWNIGLKDVNLSDDNNTNMSLIDLQIYKYYTLTTHIFWSN